MICILQLLVSSLFLWKESQKSPSPKMTTDWRTVRLYPIPSIIYLIHNNVQFATLTYVDTSTYQIMGNLKIVTTGILFRWFSIKYKWLCYINTYHFWNPYSHTRADISTSWFRLFLRRKLSNLQWMAIILLAVGTTTSQVTAIQKKYASAILQIWLKDLLLIMGISRKWNILGHVFDEKMRDDNRRVNLTPKIWRYNKGSNLSNFSFRLMMKWNQWYGTIWNKTWRVFYE